MSFKVMCINNKPIPGNLPKQLQFLKENEIYTVVDELESGYYLSEINPKRGCGWKYDISRFIPLPEFKQTTYTKILEEIPMCEN